MKEITSAEKKESPLEEIDYPKTAAGFVWKILHSYWGLPLTILTFTLLGFIIGVWVVLELIDSVVQTQNKNNS